MKLFVVAHPVLIGESPVVEFTSAAEAEGYMNGLSDRHPGMTFHVIEGKVRRTAFREEKRVVRKHEILVEF